MISDPRGRLAGVQVSSRPASSTKLSKEAPNGAGPNDTLTIPEPDTVPVATTLPAKVTISTASPAALNATMYFSAELALMNWKVALLIGGEKW